MESEVLWILGFLLMFLISMRIDELESEVMGLCTEQQWHELQNQHRVY